MTSKMRSFRIFRNPIGCLILLAAVAVAAGCSDSRTAGGSGTNVNHVLPSGSSVAGWMVTPSGGSHASTATQDYIAANGSSGCAQCHGSDLSGGISNVSCFGNPAGCHHGPVPNWSTSAVHGAIAKQAPGSSGFASCQICHAANFSGGGAQVPCSRCHIVNAPHPRAPWHSSTGSTHANTNTSNAPVCAQCHYPNSPNNPANHPSAPAPAGTAPGCFNNTLCHGESPVPHPVGTPDWYATRPAAQLHGNSAKATPGSTAGFAYCQVCHGGTGSDFAGGSSNVSCTNNPNAACHGAGVPSPHARGPWRGAPYTHTTTAEGNAGVCYQCHAYTGTANPNNPHPPPVPAQAGTAPGCYNGTMCHNQAGHPAGWVAIPPAEQPHGATAKRDGTVAGQGFPSCQVCHGADFTGGSVNQPCFTCHVPPHAPAPWRGSPYTHTDTVESGNAPVCYRCHAYTGTPNPLNPHVPPSPAPAGTTPGCYNGTMCHNQAGHPAGWVATSPAEQPHGATAKQDGTVAGQGFPSCQVCHGAVFTGGTANQSCYTCHVPPHAPAPWRTSAGTTYTHTNTVEAGNAPVCYTCHAYTGTPNPNNPHVPPSPASAGTPPGCNNGTMCHNSPVPHPVGGLWFAFPPEPQAHGNAAKATPGTAQGFAYCQGCHGSGTNFDGGSSTVSCYTTCHFVYATGPVNTPYPPHPPQWRVNDTYRHDNTAQGNGSVCAFCHTGGTNSPMPLVPQLNTPPGTSSCYNNTLCHGVNGYHPDTWPASSQHGAAAKALPSASTGFAVCQTCHGTGTTSPGNFGGGSAEVSCYLCHNLTAPHPSSWVGGGDPHRGTDQAQSNLDVCAQCHRSGPGTVGCFNGLLCH